MAIRERGKYCVVWMTILLMIVIGSPASNVNANKSNNDGAKNPDRCFQAGKDDGKK